MKKESTNCYAFGNGELLCSLKAPEGSVLVMSGKQTDIDAIIKEETGVGLFDGIKNNFIESVNALNSANLKIEAIDALSEWTKSVSIKHKDKDVVFAT